MRTTDTGLAVAALFESGFAQVRTDDNSQSLRVIRHYFNLLLSDPAAKAAFTISPELYQRDEVGEPYELGILTKKQGGTKEGAAVGFFDQAAGRKTDDPNKEQFHFSTDLYSLVIPSWKMRYYPFLFAISELNHSAITLVHELVAECDRMNATLPKERAYEAVLSERLGSMVAITRLIRYGEVEGDLPDAKVHRDRDFLTVHHYSSQPGLVLFDKDKRQHCCDETSPYSAIVFTGEKFWVVTRGKFGPGAVHGVLDERRKRGSRVGDPRLVAVTFVHIGMMSDDCAWLKEHVGDIKLDQQDYRL